MFTNWTRYAKFGNDVDRTPPTPRRNLACASPSTARRSSTLNYAESIILNKPKGRRLGDGVKLSGTNEYDETIRRLSWDAAESLLAAGPMSADLTRVPPRPRIRGPATSAVPAYQLLLPQRSTPMDQQEDSIHFPNEEEAPPYPTWTMSVGIPQPRRGMPDRKKSEFVSSLIRQPEMPARRRYSDYEGQRADGMLNVPAIMVDPYSSSAREFIASRQLLFLTRRRLRSATHEPHVWIVNYYGRAAAKAIHSKIVPGASVALADTALLAHQHAPSLPTKLTRLLGYLEVNDNMPVVERAKLRFARLIGRGGTSAVYSGGLEVGAETALPVVAKILNPKHWKCALAELVASAATCHRMTEGAWIVTDRARRSRGESSPTSASSHSGGGGLDENCPFVQGGVWLMPTELHLFWDADSPQPGLAGTAEGWRGELKKRYDQPKFATTELPALCCLMLRNSEDGVPLLTWLNTVYVKRRCKPSHEMCVYFAYTVITLVRQLHSCGLVHGDIKPDNFVLLSSAAPFSGKRIFGDVQIPHPLLGDALVCPVTVAGIDFGRSLDVKEALRDVVFVGDTQVSDFRCPSMLESLSWETQIDLTGLAVTIFTMVSLKYPKIRKKKLDAAAPAPLSVGDARGKVSHSYWFGSRVRGDLKQNEFWLGVLDRLINFDPFHTSDGHTLLDSCLLLRQLEKELLGLFENHRLDIGASYDVLYAELQDMKDFIVDYQKRGGTSAVMI
ncbi:protein kinase domain protein [Gregarina niphandrodes]|uniref:Protein kinase domain protein n=1 Tax=Gregarina niphandrodes TaxID=110365 RepID=A0A023B337_GRENI|nr:protein kinase domain protein [Gregarina niphandrodes]EZG55351.1 protein kinase domain protein [Gregarina niphandrodes]|eukprot:XP_011131617.1 protein kinase domain protein [Gregarina niphandrodes]